MFGLRLGHDPRVIVTTRPKPIKIIRELLNDPTTVVTRGSSYAPEWWPGVGLVRPRGHARQIRC
jgi:hypothetical protein